MTATYYAHISLEFVILVKLGVVSLHSAIQFLITVFTHMYILHFVLVVYRSQPSYGYRSHVDPIIIMSSGGFSVSIKFQLRMGHISRCRDMGYTPHQPL